MWDHIEHFEKIVEQFAEMSMEESNWWGTTVGVMSLFQLRTIYITRVIGREHRFGKGIA